MEGGPSVQTAVLDRVIRVTSIADMEAYSAPVGYVFSLNAGGRSGVFDVVAGDFSAELAADTLNGIYVGLSDNATATTKIAKRRYSGYINVKWFGAKGDGITDDTDSIQSAINLASITALYVGETKELLFYDGLFMVSRITIPDGTNHLTLRGNGNGEIRANLVNPNTAEYTDDKTINIINSDYIKFFNLRISGIEGETDAESLINLYQCKHFKMIECTVDTYGGYTITPTECENLTFSLNTFNKASIWSSGSTYITIENNHFTDTLYDSIKLTSVIPSNGDASTKFSDYVTIIGNVLNGGGADAIDCFTRGQNIVISNNIIKNTVFSGIQLKTVLRDPGDGASSDLNGYNRKCIVSNNVFENVGSYGIIIKMDDIKATPTNEIENMPAWFVVSGNIIDTTTRGVYLKSVVGVKVSSNIIRNCSDKAIMISTTANNTTIVDNTIFGSATSDGIYAAGESALLLSSVIISNNHITGCDFGILATLYSGVVNANTAIACVTGIFMSSSVDTVISSNTARECTNLGFRFIRFTGCVIMGNIASNNENGMKFKASVDYDSIDGCITSNVSRGSVTLDIDDDDVSTTNFIQANNNFTL